MQENTREKVKIIIDSTKIGVSKDFSVEEKQELYEHFERFGLSAATMRNRLFRDGWHDWELKGVLGCIIEYGADHSDVEGLAIEAEKFTVDEPISSIHCFLQTFYDSLEKKMTFCEYMEAQGISRGTIVSHFNNPDYFSTWEIFGIRRLLSL